MKYEKLAIEIAAAISTSPEFSSTESPYIFRLTRSFIDTFHRRWKNTHISPLMIRDVVETSLIESNKYHKDKTWFDFEELKKQNAAALELISRQGMKWQPIETAPMDGTWILGYCPTLSISKYPVTCFYEEGCYGNPRAWTTTAVTEYGSDEVYPTHWMPLPKPPKEDL